MICLRTAQRRGFECKQPQKAGEYLRREGASQLLIHASNDTANIELLQKVFAENHPLLSVSVGCFARK